MRNYETYMKGLFQETLQEDLSAESAILGADARAFSITHGGKMLGTKVLEKLVEGFGDQRLKSLPAISKLVEGEQIECTTPDDFYVHGTSCAIVRSNAWFEYGSPPGVLSSQHFVQLTAGELTSIDLRQMVSQYEHTHGTYIDVPKLPFSVLIQPQLFPKASGVMYSSFDANPNDPVIIEASTGSCISATAGLPNIVHYRVHPSGVEIFRNFSGDTPDTIFTGDCAYIDLFEVSLSRRELEVYRTVAKSIKGVGPKEIKELWDSLTSPIPGEPNSPLTQDQLTLLHDFGKYAESQLGKALKFEFSVTDDGSIILYQLDPAHLAVSEEKLDLGSVEDGFVTPFVNMPCDLKNLEVVIEALSSLDGAWDGPPTDPFAYMHQTVPLNVSIERELTMPYPQCQAIVSPVGSRMNHCYSEARTYIPFLGVIGLFEGMSDVKWGHNKGMKVDLRSDGRWGHVRFH